jgi:3-hydroxyethyl bacteriochlorophyllide a dehydrogenase
MGYPLVPGYEAAGEVVEAGAETGFRPGDMVFVPGANCYGDAKGLFGGATNRLVTAAERVVRIDPALGPKARFWRLPPRRAMRWPAEHDASGPDRRPRRARAPAGAPDTRRRRQRAHRVGNQHRPHGRAPRAIEVVHPDDDPRRDYPRSTTPRAMSGLLNT